MDITEAQLSAELICTTCHRPRLWVAFPDLRNRRLCRECYYRRNNRRNELRRSMRREMKLLVREAG